MRGPGLGMVGGTGGRGRGTASASGKAAVGKEGHVTG